MDYELTTVGDNRIEIDENAASHVLKVEELKIRQYENFIINMLILINQ